MSHPYFPRKPEKLDYIYFHIGRFVLFFADAEDAVCACNNVLMSALQIRDHDRPRNTQRRISMFRGCLEEIRISPELRKKGEGLIATFARLADHRQWVVHASVWDDTHETRSPIISYMKRKLGHDDYEFRDYHLADIEDLADECRDLMDSLWDWLTVDLGFATPDDIDQARSKIGT